MTQKDALDILKTGANVFLTGAAGSGKTHVLRQYLSYLEENGINVGITASTGIAATHMGGVTIHSWAGIGIKDKLSDWDIDAISQKEKTAKRICDAKVLIIDEISMIHHYRLDLINRVLKYVRNSEMPFGGLQIVVSGDFFQLPPISRPQTIDHNGLLFIDEDGNKAKFAYHAKAWQDADLTVCYLEENWRHNDKEYLNILNAIRNDQLSDKIINILKSKIRHPDRANISRTRLYSHNINVDRENERELSKLKGYVEHYEMTSKGKKNLVLNLKKTCLAPEILKLKVGAKVMFVKNNFEKGYVNGTTGIVKKCTPYEIVIATKSGKHIRVEIHSWHLEDHEGKSLAKIEQYPLRLAWAITIHKSQGMSLDEAEIDLSESFEKGMGYVALSRVRTLDGLSLIGINDIALKVHEEAIEYDKIFRELSMKCTAELSLLSMDDIKERHSQFLGRELI